MKHLAIITAAMLLTFTVSAQSSRNRGERTRNPEPERTERVSRPERNDRQSRKPDGNERVRSRENREGNISRPSAPATRQRNDRSITPEKRNRSYPSRENRSPRTFENRRPENSRQNNPEVKTDRRREYSGREPGNSRGQIERRTPPGNARVENARREPGRDRTYHPKTGREYEAKRRTYTYRPDHRIARPAPRTHYSQRPIEYRRKHYVYRTPPPRSIIWTRDMYREYIYLYPEFNLWYYPIGYRIRTISAYDAYSYVGEIARVYGEVFDVWYSPGTREYYLYIGGPYPYQDFTVVLDRNDARRFSRWPERFFAGRHIAATGLISVYEGKPEMFLKKRSQIHVY